MSKNSVKNSSTLSISAYTVPKRIAMQVLDYEKQEKVLAIVIGCIR